MSGELRIDINRSILGECVKWSGSIAKADQILNVYLIYEEQQKQTILEINVNKAHIKITKPQTYWLQKNSRWGKCHYYFRRFCYMLSRAIESFSGKSFLERLLDKMRLNLIDQSDK